MNEYDLSIELSDCIRYNNIQAALIYLDQYKDINEVFYHLSKYSIPSLYEYFISHGADINYKHHGNTSLHTAVLDNRIHSVELLISYGADINAIDNDKHTPLHVALAYRCTEIEEFLFSHGAEIDVIDIIKILNSSYPIHFENSSVNADFAIQRAIEEDRIGINNYLISKGIQINIKDENNNISPHDGINQNSVEMDK
ncbi:ankyrin repeat protein, putative [Trichomonas vaginalis G3]|uniref:Ankyrin repeat protein, putative n=1 Tax=Trichomonas vaginalis (strain ATCC PRA-98 / G3) TaxID=412133 RepID=A2DWF9_TRIV3|nr:proteasome regulatory particle assembly [Trichomonas vaginalis G3]EAY15299.1 ankyrin repeat protein, putative [Trichomonas vaginalis G3]KAI5536597.1 proteasome regulatory particle assembly [Trichomonas vaginalis G3]|eukprot:XP_001327522.1 ankyrin repeat protein [Trichomonas vaginalis G3]